MAGHARGEHSGSWNTAHPGDLVHNLFFVHRKLEGSAHSCIVEGLEARVKADIEQAEGGFTEALVLVVLRVDTDLFGFGARDQRIFKLPLEELVKYLLKRRTDLENHRVEKWSALVVPVVGLQDDLLVRLPPLQFERTSPHRRAAKVLFFAFNLLAGYHSGIRHAEHRKQRSKWLIKRNLQGIAINRLQPLHAWTGPLHKIVGALDASQKFRQWSGLFGVQQACERIDEILRCHLSTIMKLHAMAQGECPGAPITRRFPKLGNGGNGVQVGIELDQAIEHLGDDSPAKDIGRERGIERGGVVVQNTPVCPTELHARF